MTSPCFRNPYAENRQDKATEAQAVRTSRENQLESATDARAAAEVAKINAQNAIPALQAALAALTSELAENTEKTEMVQEEQSHAAHDLEQAVGDLEGAVEVGVADDDHAVGDEGLLPVAARGADGE